MGRNCTYDDGARTRDRHGVRLWRRGIGIDGSARTGGVDTGTGSEHGACNQGRQDHAQGGQAGDEQDQGRVRDKGRDRSLELSFVREHAIETAARPAPPFFIGSLLVNEARVSSLDADLAQECVCRVALPGQIDMHDSSDATLGVE